MTLLYLKENKYCCPEWKNTLKHKKIKIQDKDNFLPETPVSKNFGQPKLISYSNEWSLFQFPKCAVCVRVVG